MEGMPMPKNFPLSLESFLKMTSQFAFDDARQAICAAAAGGDRIVFLRLGDDDRRIVMLAGGRAALDLLLAKRDLDQGGVAG
jgi:hypothetical protein